MPLERRIFGPSLWAISCCIHGMNLSGSTGSSLRQRQRLHLLVVVVLQAVIVVIM